MRLTRYFLPVLKETPAEAQIVSHRLMLRAGMIRQAARESILGCRSATRRCGGSSRSCTRNSRGPAP